MINSFWGKYRFLSNFYSAPVFIEGTLYSTVEHYYQAKKATNEKEHDEIVACETPGQAKRIGKTINTWPEWDYIKLTVMRHAVLCKFIQNQELSMLLLLTNDEELKEGNTWHDTFWGVDAITGEGENHLGKILMDTRRIIQWINGEKLKG